MRHAAVVLACAVALSACAAPQNHYVAEKPGTAPAGSVYFTVPHTWTAFPGAAIAAAENGWSTTRP